MRVKKALTLLMGVGVGVGVLAWMLSQKEDSDQDSDALLEKMNEKIELLEQRTRELEQKN